MEWQATPDAMLYASATNGFKSGGYNPGARLVLNSDFAPETIWAYEAGAKTDWFDHRLRANISYYHYDWRNLQFNSNVAPGFSAVVNAAAAKLDGVEMQFTAKPADGLTLTANANFLASKYLSFPGGTIAGALKPYVTGNPLYNPVTTLYNDTGNEMVWAPPMTINLTAEKDFDLGNGANLFVRGEYQYTSKTQMDPTNLPITQRPAFDLINASIGYSPANSHWTVALWGKNLADKAVSHRRQSRQLRRGLSRGPEDLRHSHQLQVLAMAATGPATPVRSGRRINTVGPRGLPFH